MTWKRFVLFAVIDLVLLLAGLYYYFLVFNIQPPVAADLVQEFTIQEGEGAKQVFTRLEQANIIRSEITMELLFTLYFDSTQIKAGTYFFSNNDAYQVAEELVQGQVTNELISITFVEGETVADYGIQASQLLQDFDIETWNDLTATYEGKLFPDTYDVPPDYSARDLFLLLRKQHDIVFDNEYIIESELSSDEVLILASILEREANSEESMRTVAGVFLNRLAIGMPLQADASIEYVIDTPLNELAPGVLAQNLRELDSPYNTYLNNGLPPTPIGNPGQQAIAAVLNPISSDYLFYITGTDGEFYYAQTLAAHNNNIARHLR